MSLNSVPPKNNPWLSAFNTKALTVGGEVGCLTLLIVLGSVFLGIWLDRVLGTKPILTILFVLGSAPLSLALTFWVATRAVKDINPKPGIKSSDANGIHSPEGENDQ